jgi:hypothetical protein
MKFEPCTPSEVKSPDLRDSDLQFRITAEFAEMPGMNLTLPQASRLFHVETVRCERVLARLVAAGALAVSQGRFVRGRSMRLH